MALLNLEGFPEGSDITILDCYYNYQYKDEQGVWHPDFVVVLFIENKTGKKYHRIIENPDYTFYKINDNYVTDYNQFYIPKEQVTPITVKYKDLEKEIAKITGNTKFYEYNLKHDRYENKKIHTRYDIMFSDMKIEDNIRFRFGETYTNNIGKIRKGFFDIEVDIRFAEDEFAKLGECPINLVGFLPEHQNMVYSFVLRNEANPQIAEFEQTIKDGSFGRKQIEEFIIKTLSYVGGYKYAKRNGLLDLDYNIIFFDDELEMIRAIFRTIHKTSPDFFMGWNSSGFDLEYIISRIIKLGGDPLEVITDPRWEIQIVKNYVDTRNYNVFCERGDFTFISGDCVHIDQMIQFASRRKSKYGAFKGFKLDDIGEEVAGIHKLEHSESMRMFCWLDFLKFWLYNCFDIFVQKCIENKAQDLEYLFAKSVVNNTSYKKAHRQTVYLVNRMAKSFYERGLIIGNNVNRWNEKPDKFLGALVADPTRTNNYSKMMIDGRPIWLCNNLQDYDYKSLYPSILMEFNISPNTQIGRIDIPQRIYVNENVYRNPKYSRSGEFIENMVSDNWIEFCHRWFHLANVEEFLQDMREYFDANKVYGSRMDIHKDINQGLIHPLYDLPKDGVKAIVEFRPGEEWRPNAIYFYSDLAQNGLSNQFESYQEVHA